MALEIPFEQLQPFVGDRVPDDVLHELVATSIRLIPVRRPADSAAYKAGAEIVEKFGVDFMFVRGRDILEGGESQPESSGECLYASGGSISEGGSSLGSPGSMWRCAAVATASDRVRDSLHLRCLTRSSFGPLGGVLAFSVKSAKSSSVVSSFGAAMLQPFEPMARSKV